MGHVMAWQRTEDTPLSEPMLTQVTDAYMRHQWEVSYQSWNKHMMTSSNGNILCGGFTGHRWIPHSKSSDAELWCFLWAAPKPTLSKQWRHRGFETPSKSLSYHCNDSSLSSRFGNVFLPEYEIKMFAHCIEAWIEWKTFFKFKIHCLFWLSARWVSGFSGDHWHNHQCLRFSNCCNATHIVSPSLSIFCWK